MEKLDKLLDIAEALLTRDAFLIGDDFTLANVQFGHVLFRYFNIPIPRPERPANEIFPRSRSDEMRDSKEHCCQGVCRTRRQAILLDP